MNQIRSSYVKVLPLVFLSSLLVAILLIGRDYLFDSNNPANQLWYFDWFLNIVKNAAIWLGLGFAFRQMKAAAVALGAALLFALTDHFVYGSEWMKTSVLFNTLYSLLFNISFLPSLLFGFLCFQKKGLRYFLPMVLFSYAAHMLFVGGFYLDASPYNGWYRFLQVERLLEIRTGERTFRVLHLFSYLFNIAAMPLTFIAVGECYAAATANKKWKDLLAIDLSTNYTNGGARALFYTLRFTINLLVIGLFTFPIAHFLESGRVYYNVPSWFSFVLTMISGLALLAGAALYYRRFMVEYFISQHRKIQWQYWLVNIPVIGLFAFLLITPAGGVAKPQEDRRRFFYNNARYNLQPYKIMGVMLALSVIGSWTGRSIGYYNDVYWLLYIIEVALFIWYVASVTGYYVILGAAVPGGIIFFSKMALELQNLSNMKNAYGVYGYQSPTIFFENSIALWFIVAFNIVQYVILLPIFHLDEMKVVQEEEEEMRNEELEMRN